MGTPASGAGQQLIETRRTERIGLAFRQATETPARKEVSEMVAMYRSEGRAGQALRFVWHFLQMNIAMGIGMAALGAALVLLGYRNLSRSEPEFFALVMALSMLLPMAAWMRFGMRHSWSRTREMSEAMTIPTLVLIVVCSVGLVPHAAAVVWSMPLMVVGMIGDMIYRWPEYA